MGIRVLHWNDVERISKIVCVCVKGHGKALERPPFRAGLILRMTVHYSLMTLEKEMATRSSILFFFFFFNFIYLFFLIFFFYYL